MTSKWPSISCGAKSFVGFSAGVVIVLFWLSFAYFGYLILPELHFATSLDADSGAAHKGLEVFNDNFLHRSAFLNPMPTVAMISLRKGSSRTTVVGPELLEFKKLLEPLSTCIKPKMKCHYREPDFFIDDWNNIQCDEACNIPGAICGATVMNPLFHAAQPGFYNNIHSVSGYYQNVSDIGEDLAHQRYISADNRSTIVILQGTVPKCSNKLKWYPLTDWIKEHAKEIFKDDDFEFGITSWSEQMRSTIAGCLKDTYWAHIISLPIAWLILLATVGPSAIFVFAIMPISLLATVFILVPLQKTHYGPFSYAHISPGMWVSILIAMSIDYALFLLSRWREERLNGASKEDGIIRSVLTAGKTIVLSGLILAMSFFSLMVISTPLVQQVGASCGILILVSMLANITLIPALLLITPDVGCCYKRNACLSRMRKAAANTIISWIGDYPWIVAFIRACLSDVDDKINEDAAEVMTYDRLEMHSMPVNSIMDSKLRDFDDYGEDEDETLDQNEIDEDLVPVIPHRNNSRGSAFRRSTNRSRRSLDLREDRKMEDSSPEKDHRKVYLEDLEDDGDDFHLRPVLNIARAKSLDSVDQETQSGDQIDENPMRIVDAPSQRESLSQAVVGARNSNVLEESLLAADDEDFKSQRKSGVSLNIGHKRGGKNIEGRGMRIPSTSIWVKIAQTCRDRPAMVIAVMLLLGAPIALQCIRFRISSNFQQLLLESSKPVMTMRAMRREGFQVGVLNKQYIVATLGSPVSKNSPIIPPVDNSTQPDKPDNGRKNDGGEDDGGEDDAGKDDAGKDSGSSDQEECIPGAGLDGRRRCIPKKCWEDDPDNILRSRGQTCGDVMDQMYKRFHKNMSEASSTERDIIHQVVCNYDPNQDNPAYPDGYSVGYVCPRTCNMECAYNKTEMTPTQFPTQFPTTSSASALPDNQEISFDDLFDCDDDIAGWINRITPCFIMPGGGIGDKTFVCERSGKINCGLAGPALGRKCNSNQIGAKVGAGGERLRERGKRDVSWGLLCPSTCDLCPFDQRIFTPAAFSNISLMVDAIMNLPISVGKHGLQSITYLDGHGVEYGSALSMLNETRPGMSNEIRQMASHDSRAYRHVMGRLKSVMGSATVIELTPDWNPVGANSGEWVDYLRNQLSWQEKIINERGMPVKLYFEGMAPIITDLKIAMYKTAPFYMALSIVIVVLVLTAISFRSFTMGFRLLITVAFSLTWVFGIMVILLQDIKIPGSEGDGMHFLVPIINVPVLVGLTLDYDLFLLVRIHEYRLMGYSTQDSTMAAMYKTSGIITVAGLIMLTAFSALIASDLFVLRTTGLLIVTTCIIDTFLVRAWLVPALLMVGVEWNWWPGKVPPVTRRCRVE
eukprot:CAMPEP_0167744606 /NCGR_PEP_ID=MMETSP0110_2-20121227/2686_1 /TAXON_ID=629695 /ORGANISM="Gymnochlora sp., Strain CCMP2014" /LENGTH=1360 /DNA_ID=CAMNT_0007629149 /DNA_START=38 /DNA_END=4120 /DNA_ORIENTATION=+